MSEQHEQAAHRTPREIWWRILDEVIYSENPLVFSTTFHGRDWAEHSNWHMFESDDHWLGKFEWKRKIIGSVCRSWQEFAHERGGRHLTLKTFSWGNPPEEIDKASKAHRISLQRGVCSDLIRSHDLEQEFNWSIVEIYQTDALELGRIPLPHLRRLRMSSYESWKPLNLNPFLDILSKFTNLTWLDYQADIQRGQPVPIDKYRAPVVLPNLQTLWYKNRATFDFPFSHLVLPSLQYLSLHIYELPSQVPLLDLLSCYRQTLRSFAARGWKRRGDLPVVHFPSWEDFPNLEELVLDIQWSAHFQPLPSNHPLRRLDVQHGFFDAIPSLLEGGNMREIILQRTRWTGEGGLAGNTEELTISTIEVERILERAEERGISFKVTWDWDEFLSRDEAIAAAAEASDKGNGFPLWHFLGKLRNVIGKSR
ncbi:hypothetical protein CPB86DRAFT_797363 [Serendipita vermifera]|nr:hypothetical protein CPB86DRAFT_797363 [Serendipita vermifera]